MHSAWLPPLTHRAGADGTTETTLDLPADAPWFDGHFPGRPVLPGVASLHLVAEIVRHRARQAGRVVTVAGFRQVRFRRPIASAVRATVVVGPWPARGTGELRFQVRVGRLVSCHGFVTIVEEAAP